MSSEIYAFDPILLEKVEINKWISDKPDNIIILIDFNKNTHITGFSQFERQKLNIFALNKTYLQNVNIRDKFSKCILINEQLLPFTTFRSKSEFYNIGFYLNRNILINIDTMSESKLTGQFFYLILKNNKETYINKEYLTLSTIGIVPPIINKVVDPKNLSDDEKKLLEIEEKNEGIYNINFPINQDVYFDSIKDKALIDYTYRWDGPINVYLREGIGYFKTDGFSKLLEKYKDIKPHPFGDTPKEAKENILKKIEDLDRVFIESATRNESEKKYYWRGMMQEFAGLTEEEDKVVINNYVSMSKNYAQAVKFCNSSKSGGCIYKIFLDIGVPFIDMANTTMFRGEREVLLPRGLVFEITDITYKGTIVILASLSKTNVKEFKIKTGCSEFVEATLVKLPKNDRFFDIYNKNVEPKSNNVIAKKEKKEQEEKDYIEMMNAMGDFNVSENMDKVLPVKLARCPKGTRRNKKTGLCEPYGN
jgi:hypothetical protein